MNAGDLPAGAAAPAADRGAWVQRLRTALGLTQEQLAARLGVAFSTVNRWESGRSRPSPAAVRALLQLEADAASAGAHAMRPPVAPPPSQPAPERGSLPAPFSSFIGRRQELTELAQLLPRTRLLTLTGSGGCGKTRLAIEAARASAPAFQGGAWFIDLAPLTDAALVPAAVATALGVREVSGRPLTETLVASMHGKQLLLLLDNCEHLLAACAALVNALLRGDPGLTVLATSRELLGLSGETVYPLSPLGLPPEGAPSGGSTFHGSEAVQLFIARAASRLPGFTVDDDQIGSVAEICAKLDGLPLALELAAARIGALTVEEIALRLDDRFRLLVRGNAGPARHETLRAAIDWSHDLLDESEQALFRRLAAFGGSFALAAAEAVADSAETLDLIGRLVDKSLVTVVARVDGETRYRLLETLREYGRERLAAAGEVETTLARHAGYFAALAETLAGGGDAGLTLLDREEDNLREALNWFRARGDVAAQLRLAATLRFYWVVGGRLREGRDWLRPAAEAGLRVRPNVRAAALLAAGAIARDLGEPEQAQRELEESLELSREADDRRGIVRALNGLASIAQQRGDCPAARALFTEALNGCEELDERVWIAQTIGNLGEVALLEGDISTAGALFRQSRTLARRLGHRQAAVALANLAAVAAQEADFERARTQAEAAVAELRTANYPLWLATALETLATAHRRQGKLDRALVALNECLLLMRELGSLPGTALAVRGFALLAAAQGRYAGAVRLLAASEALARQAAVCLPRGLPGEQKTVLSHARAVLSAESVAGAVAQGESMTADEAAALALAEPGVSATGNIPLTQRQQEVLRRVAAGRSSRQIAAELVLSVRTVERHIENLYAATGLHGRAAIIDYAHRNGLTAPGPEVG
ncbi:MAG: ATP-binding protein [Dehalococcoidia bacterium]